MLPAVLLVAIVVEPNVMLRASPQDHAVRVAPLQRGDWLEVRGERAGVVAVYDHARERPGYVRAHHVRIYPLDATALPALDAVITFLKDSPGQEALGMGYVALYLKASAGAPVPAEIWDALGGMADRLARRASVRRTTDITLAGDLDVAARYGVRFVSVEAEGRTQLCYDGEAHRKTLAARAAPNARVRAALALTREHCLPPNMTATQQQTWNDWRAEVLSDVDTVDVTPWLANRLWLRRVEVHSARVFALARGNNAVAAAAAAEETLNALARVQRAELADEDKPALDGASMRASLARLALETPTAKPAGSHVEVVFTAGEPGQTCVQVRGKSGASPSQCTYAVVWPATVQVLPQDRGVTLVVQPLGGWSELWLARPDDTGWKWDVLVPAASAPGVGYVEMAGASPDGKHLLVVREALGTPDVRRDFQQLNVETLKVEHLAHEAAGFRPFRMWSSARWRQGALVSMGSGSTRGHTPPAP